MQNKATNAASPYPPTYTATLRWRIIVCTLGALLALPSLAGVWYFGTGHEVETTAQKLEFVALCVTAVMLGAYCIFAALRHRVVLTEHAMQVPRFLGARVVPRAEIAGYRLLHSNGMDVLHLVRKNGKKVNVSLLFPLDEVFADWLEGIPDLDDQEVTESMREIADDSSLGVSPADRLQNLESARKISRWLHALVLATVLWGFFYPYPYRVVIAILVLMPWLAFGLRSRFGSVFTLEDSALKTARADLKMLLLLPGFVLAVRALADVHLMVWKPLIGIGVVGAAVLVGVLLVTEPRVRGKAVSLFLWSVLLTPYPASVAAISNVLFESEPAAHHRVEVLDKSHTTGRRKDYHFMLAAWGPYSGSTEVTVDRDLYHRVQQGQYVCVHLHSGALRMPYYVVRDEETCLIGAARGEPRISRQLRSRE